jgi:hypothetical protein
MKTRRSFFATVALGLAAASTARRVAAATPDSAAVLHAPNLRLLNTLGGVTNVLFCRERYRRGINAGAPYHPHLLTCLGTYDGHGGDWQFGCWMEIQAPRPDTPLRVVGNAVFSHEHVRSDVCRDEIRIKYAPAVSLEVYEQRVSKAVLLVASSRVGPWIEWDTPAPRWPEA